MEEASHYQRGKESSDVTCRLCPHYCQIPSGESGKCLARRNEGGILYSLNYQEVAKVDWLPIEALPLYHYHPGSTMLAVGSWGCNQRCSFCDTHQWSQSKPPTRWVTSQELVDMAIARPALGIAYTYAEPIVWYEFVLETAQAAQAAGLRNVLDTGGFVDPSVLRELLPYVDAVNLDIKAIEEPFYRRVCGSSLDPVLATAEILKGRTHLEITHMILPGENDFPSAQSTLAKWIAAHLGPDTPTHLRAFFPAHLLAKEKPTAVESMMEAFQIFRSELRHVYLSNVFSQEANNTFCTECGAELINRVRTEVDLRNLDPTGCCATCGAENAIIVPRA
ncbi:MAG: AmmeMemoRadiSam system radical SAM enzyme [Planctomycetes bacterium]|nr:AmmeMemoRadiSam system radical SAM enzyme [Planctomycetota bacterium]